MHAKDEVLHTLERSIVAGSFWRRLKAADGEIGRGNETVGGCVRVGRPCCSSGATMGFEPGLKRIVVRTLIKKTRSDMRLSGK